MEESLSWDVKAWARQEGLIPGGICVGTLVCPSISGSLADSGGITGLMRYCADLRDLAHPTVQVTYRVTAKEVSIEDTILLELTSCHYGGYRLWFLCPTCGLHKRTRCTRLYIPLNRFTFGCRACHGLVYRSSQNSRRPSRVEPFGPIEWNLAFNELRAGPPTRDLFRRLNRATRNSGAG